MVKENSKALEYLEKSQRIHKNLELPKPPLSTAIYLNLIYKHLNNQYNLKDIQNKYIWLKVASSILTTDMRPKLAFEECEIGSKSVKISAIDKG